VYAKVQDVSQDLPFLALADAYGEADVGWPSGVLRFEYLLQSGWYEDQQLGEHRKRLAQMQFIACQIR
jgi:hypothetical protein